MEKLVGLLERECSLVEELHERVTTLQILIDDGEMSRVEQAADEVNRSLEKVREIEVLRGAEIHRLTDALNLPPTSSLGSLLELAPTPARDRIRLCTTELSALAADVEAAGNRASVSADERLADIEEFGAVLIQRTNEQASE